MAILLCLCSTLFLPQQAAKLDETTDQRVILSAFGSASWSLLHGSVKVRNQDERNQISKLWTGMGNDLATLGKTSAKKPIPAAYKRSLIESVETLQAINAGKTEADETIQLCQDIADDLKIKSRFAQTRDGFDMVTITANTRSGAEAISGLEIWYVSKGLIKHKAKYKRFEKFSSPTSAILPPGNYVIWAQKGETSGPRAVINLGDDGTIAKEIDLAPPMK